VVKICWMPSLLQRTCQTAEANYVPLSDISRAGTPYLAIQVATNVLAHVTASMFFVGAASSHRVVRSIIVSRYT
jgi:hypothetical protein